MIKIRPPEINAGSLSGRILEEARQHEEGPSLPFSVSFSQLDRIARQLAAKIKSRSMADRLMSHIRRKQHRINSLLVEYVTELLKRQRTLHDIIMAFYKQFKTVAVDVDKLTARLDEMQTHVSQMERRAGIAIEALQTCIQKLDQLTAGDTAAIKSQIEESKQILSGIVARENEADTDALYLAFEDTFRGSRKEIKERVRFYLPFMAKSAAAVAGTPILDIGCGRGEWLELLKENGYQAKGIDLNRFMITQCKQHGLDAVEGDALEWMAMQPPDSLGAVTGFHLIEHCPFEIVVKLLDAALRALKPGGLVIFETPNPENVIVGSNTFYLDPTHRNPVPPLLMEFLARSRGYAGVEIVRLHPARQDNPQAEGSAEMKRLNSFFDAPMDYGLIAWKKE